MGLSCALCGTGLAEGAVACPSCGEPVGRTATGAGDVTVPVVPLAKAAEPHPHQGPPPPGPVPPYGPTSVPHPGQVPGGPPPPPSAPPPSPSPAPKAGKGRTGLIVAGVVVVLAIVLAGAGLLLTSGGSDDPDTSSTSDRDRDDDEEDPTPEVDTGAIAQGAAGAEDAVEAEPTVTCPEDAATPDLVRFWQDDAGIHVVVTITTQCEADQVADDPAARFGLFSGDAALVTGTFDLSGSPLAVPAGGTSGELELLFDTTATVDHELRSRLYLPNVESSAATDGLDLRYVIRCEQDEGGGADGSATSEGPAVLDTAATVVSGAAAPTVPPPPDATGDTAALAILDQIHAGDATARDGLRNQWVPQVSAKRLDADATRDVFTGETIIHTPRVFLDKLRTWEARYGPERVVLLRGTDFPSICGTEQTAGCTSLWIVAIAEPRATREEVFFDWCGPEGLNSINGVPITDTTELNCAAYRYSDDTETPDSYVGAG